MRVRLGAPQGVLTSGGRGDGRGRGAVGAVQRLGLVGIGQMIHPIRGSCFLVGEAGGSGVGHLV